MSIHHLAYLWIDTSLNVKGHYEATMMLAVNFLLFKDAVKVA